MTHKSGFPIATAIAKSKTTIDFRLPGYPYQIVMLLAGIIPSTMYPIRGFGAKASAYDLKG